MSTSSQSLTTPPPFQLPLFRAILSGNVEKVITLLKADGENLDELRAVDHPGLWSPLGVAISTNNLQLVRIILQAGASPNAIGVKNNGTSNSPLIMSMAIKDKQLNIFSLLLEKGASIDAENPDGTTPLHLACSLGKLSLIPLLLTADANIHATTSFNSTPLHLSQIGNKPSTLDIAQKLLTKGADLFIKDNEANTPFHFCLKYNPAIATDILAFFRTTRFEPVKQLCLLAKGCSVNTNILDNASPSMIKAFSGRYDLLSAVGEFLRIYPKSKYRTNAPIKEVENSKQTPPSREALINNIFSWWYLCNFQLPLPDDTPNTTGTFRIGVSQTTGRIIPGLKCTFLEAEAACIEENKHRKKGNKLVLVNGLKKTDPITIDFTLKHKSPEELMRLHYKNVKKLQKDNPSHISRSTNKRDTFLNLRASVILPADLLSLPDLFLNQPESQYFYNLGLSHNSITTEALSTLLYTLFNEGDLYPLHGLFLSTNFITSPLPASLLSYCSTQHLETLSLNFNQIGDEGLLAIAPILPNSNIKTLGLTSVGLTSSSIPSLYEALSNKTTKVEKLFLSSNMIDDEGGLLLSKMLHLTDSSSLLRLGLAGNLLTAITTVAIREGLKVNRKFERVCLFGNVDIDDEEIIALKKVSRVNLDRANN